MVAAQLVCAMTHCGDVELITILIFDPELYL